MASLAQLVRASGCGSEGRGFDPHNSPQEKICNYNIADFFRLKTELIQVVLLKLEL